MVLNSTVVVRDISNQRPRVNAKSNHVSAKSRIRALVVREHILCFSRDDALDNSAGSIQSSTLDAR
jgi:hypothetical protein